MRRGAMIMGMSLLLSSAPVISGAQENGPIAAGRAFAERHCRLCHVIGAENRYGGISSTPSFYLFAEKIGRYEERLRSFHLRRPHLALDFKPSGDEIDALVTYVRTLEREPRLRVD